MNGHLAGIDEPREGLWEGSRRCSTVTGVTRFNVHTADSPSRCPPLPPLLCLEMGWPYLPEVCAWHGTGEGPSHAVHGHTFLRTVLTARGITLPRGKQNGWGRLTGPETPEQFHLVLIHGLSER